MEMRLAEGRLYIEMNKEIRFNGNAGEPHVSISIFNVLGKRMPRKTGREAFAWASGAFPRELTLCG
jgi:hypothetical protein